MKLFPLIILLLTSFGIQAQNNFENIYAALKTGNSKALATYFDNQLELTIQGAGMSTRNTYSKAQSTKILQEFFSKTTPKEFRELHSGAANEWLLYKIGYLETKEGKYRVVLRVKQTQEVFLIQELEFTKE